MFLLSFDVAFDIRFGEMAHGEDAIPRLPPKFRVGELIVNPTRRIRFDLLNQSGDAPTRQCSEQQVNVIGDATDANRDGAFPRQDSAEVLPKATAPFRCDRRLAIFSAKYSVIMKFRIGGGQFAPSSLQDFKYDERPLSPGYAALHPGLRSGVAPRLRNNCEIRAVIHALTSVFTPRLLLPASRHSVFRIRCTSL